MQLIVNADDFGKSADVNRAITECFEKGYIDRTTIMVNMPDAPDAAKIAKDKGFDGCVGVHLNLTEGRPLTKGISENPLFCDESGCFTAAFYKNTLLRLHMNRRCVEDIYIELKAQLDRYSELGFSLNHIDSHHHVHTNFPVFKALKKLSREYDFESVRLSRNLYTGGSLLQNQYKKFYNNSIKKICKGTTDFFGSFEDAKRFSEQMNVTSKSAFRDFLSGRILEIMVHPMYSEDRILVDTKIPFEEEILLYEAIR